VEKLTDADFYERVHCGNEGDVEFYLRITEGARHVLELGCGSARITLPIAARGTPILGVDVNEVFAAQARERLSAFPQASVLHGDIRTLSPAELERAMAPLAPSPTTRDEISSTCRLFDRIIVPYNTLYALGGRSGVLACLKLAQECLTRDGELWCDVYPMEAAHEALVAGGHLPLDDDEPVARFAFGDQQISVLESTELDPRSQHLEASYRALNEKGELVARLLTEHDYLLIAQIEELLQEAGLQLMLVSGSFDGAPFDEDADHLVFGAERAAAP
jgi:SAM-dependent methyltransferase